MRIGKNALRRRQTILLNLENAGTNIHPALMILKDVLGELMDLPSVRLTSLLYYTQMFLLQKEKSENIESIQNMLP